MPNVLNLISMNKLYSVQQARSNLPTRKKRDNKTRGGKCLIVAGSAGQWGAGILCARAAARCGAGYVYLYDPKSKFPSLRNPDFLTVKNFKNLHEFNAVAIGPGFHDSRIILLLLRRLIRFPKINVVLDAEALNTLAKTPNKIQLPAHWILTPHEGELSRLIKTSSHKIKLDRHKYAELAQKLWGTIIVLKGFKTLVVENRILWEIPTGNPALAKAGTGDVLTGMITAFLSQNLPPRKAACLAAFIHGLSADRWISSNKDQLSLLATDVIESLPKTLSELRKIK